MRVAAVTVSNGANVRMEFGDNPTDRSDLMTALQTLPTEQPENTNLHLAINKVRTELLRPGSGFREYEVPTDLIILTDGVTTEPDLLVQELRKLDARVTPVVFGIGDTFPENYLQSISEVAFQLTDVEALDTYTAFIVFVFVFWWRGFLPLAHNIHTWNPSSCLMGYDYIADLVLAHGQVLEPHP